MKFSLLCVGFAMAIAYTALGQRRGAPTAPHSETLGKTDHEKRILAELDEMAKRGEGYLNVPAADGRMLRILTEISGAKHVVEIGTSTGYSGLWFSLALENTGGKLTTFEMDHGRANSALEHFRKAGVDRLVTVVEGDAHANVTKLKDAIDVLFIDADKEGYVDYLNKLLPLVRPGGLILAHNVEMVPAYVKTVSSNAALDTIFYMEGNGLAITLKKR